MGCQVSQLGPDKSVLQHRRSGRSGEEMFKNNRFVANLVTVQTAAIVPLMKHKPMFQQSMPKSPRKQGPSQPTTLWGTKGKIEPRRHSDVTQYCMYKTSSETKPQVLVHNTDDNEQAVAVSVTSVSSNNKQNNEEKPTKSSKKPLNRLNTGDEIEDCYRRMGSSLF